MEDKERFEISIYANIINHLRTSSKDSALSKIESMVGKIQLKFKDYETGYEILINDYKDYQTLLENYEVKDNESRFIQKGITDNKDISGRKR